MTESPNVIELQENSRVSVLWKETGQSFEGTVAKTHSDGSYDIVYDELIQGSICRENHVTIERITLLNVMEQDDIYWKDSHNVASIDQEDRGSDVSSLARPALPLPYSLEYNPVVEKICKVNDVEERVNLSDLDDNDVNALFDAISLDKLLNLGKSAPSKLRQIFQAFVTRLEKFENISGIAENVNIVAGEFDVEVCKEITILMRCIIAVIRINTILNSDRVSATDSSAPIPEEFFEKVLRFLHSFFSTNLSDVKRMAVTNVSSRSKERASPVSPVKESKFKGTDAASKRFIQFLCKDFLHLISSFLDVLQIFLNSSKPSSTVMNLLIDFSFDVLRLDPLNNPIVNVVDIRMRSQLLYLFKSAVVVVRLLYSLADETFRGMIEQQIIQRLRDSYENKNPYRPLLVDQRAALSHDQSTITSITTGTYCMLSCIQALIKSPIAAQKALTVKQEKKGSESDQISSKANTAILSKPATSIEPEDMMSDCYLLISNILVLLFQYCSNNKDLSAEYYQVFMQLLQECLTAAISPLWPSAGIFAEKAIYSLFVQLKKSVEEGVVSNESSSSKREIYHINQIIDILSALGEQMSFIQKDNQQASLPADLLNELLAVSVNPANFDGRSEEAKAFTLQSFIVQLIRLKWKQVQPLWSKLLSETEASDEHNDIYWDNDLSSPTTVSPLKKKNSASSNSPTELLPYLKQLDSLIEINSDVLDLLEERMTSFDCSKQISQLVENGAIDATLLLLPTIHESQNLARLLEEVTDVDIKYGRLLRFIIEQHGGYRFNEVDPFHRSPDDLQHRDACLFTISFWAQYKKYHQRRQESCPALLQLAVHLTENQMTNANNPNFVQKTVLPYFIQERKIQSHKLSEDLTRSIIVQRTFQPLLSKLLEALLYMIGDTSPLVRARSVKALSKFIHSNLEKILQDNQGLCDTIVSILYDRSIAVREEGVKLIGPIIASGYSQENIGNRLLEELKPLLLDEGISVRKSVVIIMRDILQNQPIHVQYIDLCARLLERLSAPKEEESIKETICAIFQQIWFSPPSINAIQVMRNLFTSSSQITSTGSPYYQLGLLSRELSQGKSVGKEANLKDFKDFYVEFTALQLIEVSLMDVSHAWILTLLQELLHQKEKGNETSSTAKQRREASFQHCEKIVAFMKELLILIEENRHTAVINFLHARNFSPADYKVSIIATIALFCEAHPPFVSRHLLVFLPYLKGDSELSPAQNVAVCGYVMKILESVAVLEKSNLSFVNPDRIIEDLVTIAFTQSGKNISSSISCIASLIAYVTLDGVPFIKLAEKCFVSLTQTVQSLPTNPSKIDQLHPQQSARLQRCLVIYGYLCEHSRKCKTILLKLPSNYLKELEPDSTLFKKHLIALNERVAQMSFREVTGFDPRLFYGIGYSVVMYSLSLPDPAVQLRAIQCLCGIFAGYPRIMLLAKEKEHIRQVLSDRFNETLHERFLIGLKEMMVSEEQQLEKKASIQQMKESGVGISKRTTVLGGAVDHDSDATIAGFVLQQYHKDLTEFLKKPSISLRYCTLQLFATLLRQGMICPLDILALAVMLLGDENEEIRQESLILLQIQDERHPNFLDSRLIEGIEAAHDFQLQTFNHLTPVLPKQRDIDTSHSIFSSLYLTCIVPNKKRKIQFLYGLLRRCISTVVDATALLSVQEEGGGISSPMKLASSSVASPQGKPLAALSTKRNTSSNKSKDGDGASAKVTEKNFLDQLDRLGKKFSKVRYYAMTLATLPFVSIDEVLYIIHWIGRTVPTDCVIVLKKLESIYAQLGIIGGGGTSTTPKQTKSEEGNAKAESSDPLNHMMRLDEVKWRGIIDPLIQGGASHSTIYQTMYELLSHHFQLRCEEILIRLKSYFKIIYNLSDEKCQNFDPNDKSSAAFSSSEKLNNDRYFDFQLSSADSNPVENHVTKERLVALIAAGRGKEKERDREAVLLQRETGWRDVFLHCLQDYHRVHHIIHTDGDDFKLESHLSSTGTNQRRRKTASTPVASNAESKMSQSASGKKRKAIKGSATKKTPTKRKKLNFDEDEDGDDVGMDVDDDDEDAEFELAEEKSKKRQKTAVATSTLSPAVTPSTRSSRRGVSNPATSAIAQHVKQHPQQLFADDA